MSQHAGVGCAQGRRNQAGRSYLPNESCDVEEWIKKHFPQGLPFWQEARQLASHVQRLNQTNGELIQIKLRYNPSRRSAYSTAPRKALPACTAPTASPTSPAAAGRWAASEQSHFYFKKVLVYSEVNLITWAAISTD